MLLLNSCSLLCVLNVICHFLLADLKELYICIKFRSNCEKSWKSLASVCVLVYTHQEVMGEMKTTTVTLEDHKKRQHFGLLVRPRNQVALICSGKACSFHVHKKVRQVVSKQRTC